MPKPGLLPKQLLDVLKNREIFPIGALAYYGPDDQTCTRIIACVIIAPDAIPRFQHWQGDEVCADPLAATEIGRFFKLNGVQDVRGPLCPFWRS